MVRVRGNRCDIWIFERCIICKSIFNQNIVIEVKFYQENEYYAEMPWQSLQCDIFECLSFVSVRYFLNCYWYLCDGESAHQECSCPTSQTKPRLYEFEIVLWNSALMKISVCHIQVSPSISHTKHTVDNRTPFHSHSPTTPLLGWGLLKLR